MDITDGDDNNYKNSKNYWFQVSVCDLKSSQLVRYFQKLITLKMFYKSSILLTIFIIFISFVIYCDSKNLELVIKLPGLGEIKGELSKTSWSRQIFYQFLGIPYAESPSKQLRFKAPVPRLPWNNILDGTKYGRVCPVITSILKLSETELQEDLEDCLNLCVFTKDITGNRPVMMYIHGGGFFNGSAADHPPNYLLEKDIVLVVIQYRIGIFGFLSTQTNDIPGNMGVLDVILALEWIQKYIHNFGGNPNNVTIFGQSAGAAITNLLTISPIVPDGLFHRAIIQSGSIYSPWAIHQEPIKKANYVCKKCGCLDCSNVIAINKCLMEMKTENIVKQLLITPSLSISLNDFNGVLPVMPIELMGNRSRTRYPIMAGTTKHDGTYVLSVIYDMFKSNFDVDFFVQMTPRENIRNIIKTSESDNTGIINNLAIKLLFTSFDLSEKNNSKLIPNYIDFASVLNFKSPVLHYIDLISQYTELKNYLYTFDYSGQYTRFGYESELGTERYPFNGGVHHSDDNLYLFPYPYNNLNINDQKIAKKMVDLWTSFASTGEPKFKNGRKILPVTSGTGPYFRINNKITIGDDYTDEFLAAINDPDKDKLIKY